MYSKTFLANLGTKYTNTYTIKAKTITSNGTDVTTYTPNYCGNGIWAVTIILADNFSGGIVWYDNVYPTAYLAGEEINSLPTTGNGTYAVAITVTDGTNPISGAFVRLGTSYGTTDTSGLITFGTFTGSYQLLIVKAGYTYTPETLTISADTTATKALTANSIPNATNPLQQSVYTYIKDNSGNALINVSVSYEMITIPVGVDTGTVLPNTIYTALSTVTGLVSMNWYIGSYYQYWCGNGPRKTVYVTHSDTPTALPDTIRS